MYTVYMYRFLFTKFLSLVTDIHVCICVFSKPGGCNMYMYISMKFPCGLVYYFRPSGYNVCLHFSLYFGIFQNAPSCQGNWKCGILQLTLGGPTARTRWHSLWVKYQQLVSGPGSPWTITSGRSTGSCFCPGRVLLLDIPDDLAGCRIICHVRHLLSLLYHRLSPNVFYCIHRQRRWLDEQLVMAMVSGRTHKWGNNRSFDVAICGGHTSRVPPKLVKTIAAK